ncbi:MAG: NAD(P)/FAD-dependent oxidoreductase [Streptococcaceae bacterium]|jgi:NADH dehydrogenase|nr:NAD(P)/FAD-dependent oxidoreductase [Streptococcaceae bacterium]
MTKKIVVIGAGFAGIKATRTLSSALKGEAEITLIDRHSYHTMMTQLHEVAAGRVPFTNAQYDLGKLLGRRKNVKLVTDEVTGLDKAAKTVKTASGEYPYDYLVVSIGGEPNDFGVPGVREHGFTLWSMEDALRIKRHLEATVEQASMERDVEKRKAMLNFSVAGSGFTGIEMVGELIEWRDVTAKAWKLDPAEFTLNVVEMMPSILNMLDRKLADRSWRYLEKKGVHILVNHAITEVAADHITVSVGGKDQEKVTKVIPTHTLIWTTGVQGNTQGKAYELTESERGSRLVANDYMEAKGFEGQGIFVAGDVSAWFEQEGGRPQAQVVEAAEQTAHCAANNIIADIKGGEKHKMVLKLSGTMVSIGGRYGVAHLYNRVRLSGFFAMFMKNFIYVIYAFWNIKSLWYFFTYLKNEIFHTPDGRNLGRGHFSRLANVLWSFPLRLFYGLIWLLDALPKVFGGFNIGGIFGKSSQSWMGGQLKISTFLISNPKNSGWLTDFYAQAHPSAGASAHETVTKATGHFAFNAFNGLSYDYGTTPNPVTNGVPHWMQAMMKLIMPNTQAGYNMALLLQKMMSFIELALALAILVGAFTWLASAGTAGLTAMFALTGMLTWVSLWYIPVAIALMCGAGRALGLDRWIQPWIQKHFFHWWYKKNKSVYYDE